MQFYNNIFGANNKGKRIMNIDKLYEGQNYLLDDMSTKNIKCGPLIKKNCSDVVDEINYYGMYFRVGFAKYDGINIKDQIHQYHLQSHLNLPNFHLHIYEYNLEDKLQKQIKCFWYYKKTINNLCEELNISEDIQRIINKFL